MGQRRPVAPLGQRGAEGLGPLAIDEVIVQGNRADLWCKPITLTFPLFGYAAGADVFVIGVDETASPGTTTLTVLRKLDS